MDPKKPVLLSKKNFKAVPCPRGEVAPSTLVGVSAWFSQLFNPQRKVWKLIVLVFAFLWDFLYAKKISLSLYIYINKLLYYKYIYISYILQYVLCIHIVSPFRLGPNYQTHTKHIFSKRKQRTYDFRGADAAQFLFCQSPGCFPCHPLLPLDLLPALQSLDSEFSPEKLPSGPNRKGSSFNF